MKGPFVSAFACLGILLASIPGTNAQAQALVIEGGTLINGTGGAPLDNAVVVMEGSRIKTVGTKGKVSYPPNARVISADGKTILPGLIDVDIHFRGWDPQMFLHYGVTTVYEPSNPTAWIVAQRELINHGKIQGPRLFVSGDPITGPRELSRLSSGPEQSGGIIHVTTVEEAKEAVRKNAAAGVDMIHVEEALTPELLKAVVDEAAKHHLPVYGHSRDIREAAQAGLRYMEHSVPLAHSILEAQDPKQLDEFDWKNVEFPGAEYRMNPASYAELIKFMVSKGVFVNFTYSLQWGAVNPRFPEWTEVAAAVAKEPGIEFVPEDVRRGWNLALRKPNLPVGQLADGFKRVQEFTRQYAQAGGKLLVGTDSYGGVSLQGAVLSFEMESLVDAGATPMQAIMAATKNAAELGYKDKDLGTVEPGKLADVVVIDGNPLQDMATIRNVTLVVKDGKVVDRKYDAKFVNPIPRTTLNGQLKGPDNGPELTTLAPLIAVQGSKDVVIQLNGKRFDSHSVVRFNAVDLKTHFVSDSQLTAVIPSTDLHDVGTYQVTVASPDSGVKSNLRYFIVNFKY